ALRGVRAVLRHGETPNRWVDPYRLARSGGMWGLRQVAVRLQQAPRLVLAGRDSVDAVRGEALLRGAPDTLTRPAHVTTRVAAHRPIGDTTAGRALVRRHLSLGCATGSVDDLRVVAASLEGLALTLGQAGDLVRVRVR